MNNKDFWVLLLGIISIAIISVVFFPGDIFEEEPCRITDQIMPDLEGGPFWTVYIDNLSTPQNEAVVIWEGYEGDYMDANLYIPTEGHRYRIMYVGSTGDRDNT